jgi:hypothetical protein
MDYFEMLEGPAEPEPGQDELRAIVARAGRRRWRVLGAGVAAALVAGGAIGGAVGYSASNHSKGSVQTASSPAASASGSKGAVTQPGFAPATLPGMNAAYPLSAPQLTALFFRTANGVTIRAYKTRTPVPLPVAGCQGVIPTMQGVHAELSTSRAVGVADSYASGRGGMALSPSVFGQAEGSPDAAVIVFSPSDVATVKMAFTGGAVDQMRPVGGWAVLAGPVAPTSKVNLGVLTSYAASGKQLSSTTVTLGGSSWFGYGSPGAVTGSAPAPGACWVSPPMSAGGGSSSGSGGGPTGVGQPTNP